ncbi:MAG: hypothetical protein IPL53_19900 [Ignavibacteria bacterium]|nr:hypothetical protein [Ignavibacteria bacterium]
MKIKICTTVLLIIITSTSFSQSVIDFGASDKHRSRSSADILAQMT